MTRQKNSCPSQIQFSLIIVKIFYMMFNKLSSVMIMWFVGYEGE